MNKLRLLALLLAIGPAVRAADLPALWAERVKSVVAVEYYTETETERRPTVSYGTVIDREGTIILPPVAVNSRMTPTQLKDFKVYRPGSAVSVPAVYLGQDALTGWHFVRAAEAVRMLDLTEIHIPIRPDRHEQKAPSKNARETCMPSTALPFTA